MMRRDKRARRDLRDVIGCAVMVARCATGEVTEELREAVRRVTSGLVEAKAARWEND
jgi:hypothetical protein